MSGADQHYGPVFSELVQMPMTHELGPGQTNHEIDPVIRAIDLEAAFEGQLNHQLMGLACMSGLWLGFNHLNDSHMISQAIENSEGSFWHGIMHRREGDFWNAKYWFRQVGQHPVIEALSVEYPDYVGPAQFVDRVQATIDTPGREYDRCSEIQASEWKLLFDHCYHAAKA